MVRDLFERKYGKDVSKSFREKMIAFAYSVLTEHTRQQEGDVMMYETKAFSANSEHVLSESMNKWLMDHPEVLSPSFNYNRSCKGEFTSLILYKKRVHE